MRTSVEMKASTTRKFFTDFATCSPCCWTGWGSNGVASESLFCTCTWAVSGLVPFSNVSVTVDWPSDSLVDAILADLPLVKGDRVAVLVNGLGATPAMELYIMFRRAAARLGELGVTIHRRYVGEYVTSLEMAGASVTLIQLDDELARLVDAPARTPMFVQN